MAVSTIQEGEHVIFRRDGLSRVFLIRKTRQVYFEKSKFNVDELIGQPYGSSFEIDRGRLIKFVPDRIAQLKETISSAPEADNRNLLDTESNQKMSKDDIMKMKDDGMTGEKIIEELIENSETFRNKTEFSQAKYLKKKKKKHILMFTVLRPTPRLVMEIFSKDPGKICFLRPDTLSQLLNYSNVMYGSYVAVVETCQGLVLACALQRIGGQGKLIHLIPNAHNAACRQVMDYFSFPKEHLDNMLIFPLDKLSALSEDNASEKGSTSENLSSEDSSKNELLTSSDTSTVCADGSVIAETVVSSDKTEVVVDLLKKENDSKNCSVSEASVDDQAPEAGLHPASKIVEAKEDIDKEESDAVIDNSTGGVAGRQKRPLDPNRDLQRQQKIQRQKEAGDIIKNKRLDSLILACKYNPAPLLMKLLEFVAPSRPVVVYCQYLEPLIECYTQIKRRGYGLQLRLSETWFREYQVLPQRTHPVMNMSGTGGYLLTFMTVQSDKASS